MKIKNKPLRYTVGAILFIPVMTWTMLGAGLFYLGSGIRHLGNWMTGFRMDDSIGSVFIR